MNNVMTATAQMAMVALPLADWNLRRPAKKTDGSAIHRANRAHAPTAVTALWKAASSATTAITTAATDVVYSVRLSRPAPWKAERAPLPAVTASFYPQNSPWGECDDGNNIDGDGCSADCMIEPGW